MPVTLTDDETYDHVAHLTIDAGNLNLLSPEIIDELRTMDSRIDADVSVITLSGAGEGLTAGLQLDAVKDYTVHEARTLLTNLRDAIRIVRDLSAVTVCGCGGYALGAGLELAMACDFRVADEEAALGLPEIDVGLVTGIQGALLVRLVGLQAAKELVYLGRPVSGTEAADLGLVNHAVPTVNHDSAVNDIVDTLARKSPVVLQRQKEVFRAWRSVGIEHGIDHSLELIAACFDTTDQTEAMEAFFEDRDPVFRGE